MKNVILCLSLGLLFNFVACDEKEDDVLELTIPTTYNFDNVSYAGQTARLFMLSEMKTYMATAQTSGVKLDAAQLQAMFENNDTKANFARTYDATKQLRNKTFEFVQNDFDDLLSALAIASASTMPGSEGVAGVVTSEDGSKSYLLDEKGLDQAQLIEKGLMGATLYYQATSVYMGVEKMEVDNETVEAGRGTTMEHHWDEAFGYFGVPIGFPTDTDGMLFWGKYAQDRDAVLGSSQQLMDALLKGRAAISAKDLSLRDEAITEARDAWELIAVGSALHYLNSGIANFNDMALRGHGLSEGIGFIYGLKFNETRKITNEQIEELLELVAGSANFADMNLYETRIENLETARTKLAEWYGLIDKLASF